MTTREERETKKPKTIFDAVRSGDFERVAEYISKGGAVHESDAMGLTMLHHCCFGDGGDINRKMMELLTQQPKVDLEAQDQDGFTPLAAAASFGNLAAVDVLIACGVNANARDSAKRTPLHLAALCSKQNGPAIASKLIKEGGASLAIRSIAMMTPGEAAKANGASQEMLTVLGVAIQEAAVKAVEELKKAE
jgi:ankyrin repeat protein